MLVVIVARAQAPVLVVVTRAPHLLTRSASWWIPAIPVHVPTPVLGTPVAVHLLHPAMESLLPSRTPTPVVAIAGDVGDTTVAAIDAIIVAAVLHHLAATKS